MGNESDHELDLLESLYASRSGERAPSQRDLADSAGLSLGMTNALLRRFAERGWLKFTHLTGRSLQYALTIEGIAEISRRSVAYFTRAARNASMYRDRIEEFARLAGIAGYRTLVLLGPAELDFLFDYSCVRHGLEFRKNPDPALRDRLAAESTVLFVDAGEAGPEPAGRREEREVSLASILMGEPAPGRNAEGTAAPREAAAPQGAER